LKARKKVLNKNFNLEIKRMETVNFKILDFEVDNLSKSDKETRRKKEIARKTRWENKCKKIWNDYFLLRGDNDRYKNMIYENYQKKIIICVKVICNEDYNYYSKSWHKKYGPKRTYERYLTVTKYSNKIPRGMAEYKIGKFKFSQKIIEEIPVSSVRINKNLREEIIKKYENARNINWKPEVKRVKKEKIIITAKDSFIL
jgi:hypothetical protein